MIIRINKSPRITKKRRKIVAKRKLNYTKEENVFAFCECQTTYTHIYREDIYIIFC